MTSPRRALATALAALTTITLACTEDDTGAPMPTTTTSTSTTIAANGTTLHLERHSGTGAPLLMIHGGAEDAGMLAPQAESLRCCGLRGRHL